MGIFQSLKCRTMYPNSIPTRYGAMRQYGFTYVKEPASIPLALQQQNYSHITWYPQNCCDPLVYWILKFLILPAVITFLQCERNARRGGEASSPFLFSRAQVLEISHFAQENTGSLYVRYFSVIPKEVKVPCVTTKDLSSRQKRCPFGTGLNCWSLRGVRLTRVKVTWTNMSS